MSQKNKHRRLWEKTRKQWLRDNPPNHEGYYVCDYCYKWVGSSEVTLDHMDARSRRPDLRYDKENLTPSCYQCNNKKGSKSYKEFKKKEG